MSRKRVTPSTDRGRSGSKKPTNTPAQKPTSKPSNRPAHKPSNTPAPDPPYDTLDTPDATATVRVTRVFEASASAVLRAFNDPTRRDWAPGRMWRVVSVLAPRFVRMAWPDGSLVSVSITRQGNTRTSIVLEHSKLPDDAAVKAAREEWRAALSRMAEQLDFDD
jgi:hypothetical protein